MRDECLIEKKKVSVIIPYYNTGEYVREAILSVLCQQLNDYEIILVDDGSSEEHKSFIQSVAKEFKGVLRLIRTENRGAAAARNTGAAVAKYHYLAFLDSDDVWLPNKIKRQLLQMDSSGARVSIGNIKVVDKDLRLRRFGIKNISNSFNQNVSRFFYGGITMCTPTIVVEKELFDMVGGFEESLMVREDHFFLMCAIELGGVCLDDKPLTLRRELEGSLSSVSDVKEFVARNERFWCLASSRWEGLSVSRAKRMLLLNLLKACIIKNESNSVRDCLALLGFSRCWAGLLPVASILLFGGKALRDFVSRTVRG